MIRHTQLPLGKRGSLTWRRQAGLVLALGALLFTSSTFAGQSTRTVSRDGNDSSFREEAFGDEPTFPDRPRVRAKNVDFPPSPPPDLNQGQPQDLNQGMPQDSPRDEFRQEPPQPPVRRRPRDFDRMSPQSAPPRRPAPRHEREEDTLPEHELIQRKLSSRYGNPAVVHLMQSLSTEKSVELYAEVSVMIDMRHLKPSTYDARVKQAAKNLAGGLENRAFLRANGLDGDPSRLSTFRADVEQLLNCKPISGRDEAYQALRWAMRTAEQHAGIRPATIALEFVYGATDSLDKYSGFVPALDRAAPSVELEDHIVGVGVEIKPDEQGLIIVNALPGGPAAEAGLCKGDLIESVNGKPVAGETLEAAVNLITGPTGSRVTLAVRREEKVAEVALVRRRVEVHSVSEVKMLNDSVGYIKLDKFAQNSSDECDQALWSLYRQGMKSVVIDVRGNPGGLLTTAIQMCNKFVPEGTLVSTRGRDSADNTMERATRQHTWKLPLVVLVDHNSASASEIFAAAVQENSRGVIVGERTYGKGTVQTHFPLQSVSANLRLTTAQFFSPTGRTMAGAGVEPDTYVAAEVAQHRGRHNHSGHRDPEGRFGNESGFGHEEARFEEFHKHEAAFRHGADGFRGEPSGADRALDVALEAATSERAVELAQAAGSHSPNGAARSPVRPMGN